MSVPAKTPKAFLMISTSPNSVAEYAAVLFEGARVLGRPSLAREGALLLGEASGEQEHRRLENEKLLTAWRRFGANRAAAQKVARWYTKCPFEQEKVAQHVRRLVLREKKNAQCAFRGE
jgi:hypothetical protein